MAQSLVEVAIELTLALMQRGNVSPEDLQDTLQKTYATLATLKAQEASGDLYLCAHCRLITSGLAKKHHSTDDYLLGMWATVEAAYQRASYGTWA
jgi:hypothetical protein